MVSSTEVMLQLPALVLPALPACWSTPQHCLPEMNSFISRKRRTVPLPAAGTPGARGAFGFCGGAGAPRTQIQPTPRGQLPGERQRGDVRAGEPGRAGQSGGGVTSGADGAGGTGSLGARSLSQLQPFNFLLAVCAASIYSFPCNSQIDIDAIFKRCL